MSQARVKATNGDCAARAPMDIKHIQSLVELMVANDLSRIELREGCLLYTSPSPRDS